ncbi:MAG: Hsp70 family protein [Pseudomonadota bacterium]|nr:Hsp70 family protein [Pseudomonadota bacterium]
MRAIECPACSARNSPFDRYCGACGAPLARVAWRGANDVHATWAEGDGIVVVHRDARSVAVELSNGGVTPTAVVLRSVDIARLPPWVDRDAVREWFSILPPGGTATLVLPLRRSHLDALFDRRQGLRREDAGGQLVLLTTLSNPASLALDLVLAREPRLAPAGSIYPFVAREVLGELVHEVEVLNEAADELEITRIQVQDARVEGPAGVPRISAAAVVRLGGVSLPATIAPKDRHLERFGIQLPEGSPTIGWLAAELVFYRRTASGALRVPLRAVVEATIGAGPSLVFDNGERSIVLGVAGENARAGLDVTVRNPGAVPVRVLRVAIERADGTPAPSRDWLRVTGLDAPANLEAGGARTFHLAVSPAERPPDELRRQSCERVVRLWHDGWPNEPDRVAVVRVQGRFDETLLDDNLCLGVDFGTSNSMVCVVRGSEWATLMVDHGPPPSEVLPSLLFYDCTGKLAAGGDHFLVGGAAQNTAQLNPANLVRSIKSIVARDPGHTFHFECGNADGGFHFHRFTSQGLLDYFIDRLRLHAEQLVPFLEGAKLRRILRQYTSVRFTQAVFTHPVDVTTETRQALLSAAQHAGLAAPARDLAGFARASCIDEATAAVLAYVYLRIYEHLKVDLQLDRERVLCFDVGGGTTDVATVEVHGIPDFLAEQARHVTVSLQATAGNACIGGDDVDTLVARCLVLECGVQAEEAGAPIDTDELLRALECRSLTEFRQQYHARRQSLGPGGDAPFDPIYEIYAKAMELRAKAEEVKRQLNTRESAEVVLSGAGWPRSAPPQTQSFRVVLHRREIEEPLRTLADQQLRLLDQAVGNAGWGWEDVTTLLFTGGGTRMTWLREQVLGHIASRRGGPIPIVVQPGDRHAFDPKRCVALGAAVWGVSLAEGAWIRVENRTERELTYDVQRRLGPRFFAIPGLARGATFPAEAELEFEDDRKSLELYRNRADGPFVVFNWAESARRVRVRVLGPSDFRLVVHERECIAEKPS